jgi:hypothetical protein
MIDGRNSRRDDARSSPLRKQLPEEMSRTFAGKHHGGSRKVVAVTGVQILGDRLYQIAPG